MSRESITVARGGTVGRAVSLEIRPASPADFPVLADLCVTAYAPFVGVDHIYIAELRDVARRAAAAEVLVAAEPDDGRVLGTVTLVPEGGPLGEIADLDEAEFRMLAVDPAARGRGVGTSLLRRILDDSRRRGKRGVVCSSLPTMRDAHRIYERLGFRRIPERDWSPVPGVDLIAFAISL
jgi:GNAT superfamily N-acetyltransferase